MSATPARDDGMRELLREALRWRLAGLLLRRPEAGRREEIAALEREARDPDLSAAATGAGAASEGRYLALVGPGGAISPREVSYRPLEDPGRLLAGIAAFHEAFSYRCGVEDPRDHVAVAADFVGFLTLKEAYALETGRADDARTTREAREHFIARHLRATVRGMLRRLETIAGAQGPIAAALGALATLAGPAGEGDEPEPRLDDALLPRPGLDEVFQCGGIDGCAMRADS